MSGRYFDSKGLFWQDPAVERRHSPALPIARPPVPPTGWVAPTTFPNLSGAKAIAVDLETKDPELKTRGPGVRRGAQVLGIAIGTDDGFRGYYPVGHEYGLNMNREQVYAWAAEQLNRPNQPKIGANLLYDLDFLAEDGVTVRGPFYDVQNAQPLLNENQKSYSLESLAVQHLGEHKTSADLLPWLRHYDKKSPMNHIYQAPPELVGPYAEGDVDLPLRIFDKQEALLREQELWDLFLMESSLIEPLLAMRRRGVPVNLAATEELIASMQVRQAEILARIKHLTGKAVDVWAADSVAVALDQCGLIYPRTDSDNPSFQKTWLERHEHEVPRMVAEARHLDKFVGTFLHGYIQDNHINGRLHGQFHQLRGDEYGAVSGRFSSSNPNLQNIPTRTVDGKLIRSLFMPETGMRWVKFDWSQIEYRLIVHYAALMNYRGAEKAANLYRSDRKTDFHQVVADMAGIVRGDAKTLNFGLAYGQGVALLCHNLNLDRDAGEALIREYNEKAPFIRQLANLAQSRVIRSGQVRTLGGRLRRFHLWEDAEGKTLPDGIEGVRRAFAYKGLNALIQGSAADIMKKALVVIWQSGVCDVLGPPYLTVHDELDWPIDPGNPKHLEAYREIIHIMETCVTLSIPLVVDHKVGLTWGDT